MAFTVLGILVALTCAWASARRLAFAASITGLDPKALVAALRGSPAIPPELLRAELEAEPAAVWERDLFSALDARGPGRIALVNEQLAELDYHSQRWARVPRVCASISSTSGFLLASLTMRAALASESADVSTAVASAINGVTVGIAGAAFCIAAQARAGALVKERLAAVDKLVERLEANEGAGVSADVVEGGRRPWARTGVG